MKLPRDSREFLRMTVNIEKHPDVDPADARLEVSVDGGEWLPWDWDGDTVDGMTEPGRDRPSVPSWVRTGRSLYAGPDAETDGTTATVLPVGRLRSRWRLAGLTVELPVRPGEDVVVE